MFHAVPQEKYSPIPPDHVNITKKKLGLKPNDKVVIVPTKIGPGRGNKYLLRAASQVLKVEPTAFFVVACKLTYFHRPPDERFIPASNIKTKEDSINDLHELASILGIDKRILFLDSWENLDHMYVMSECVVAPYLSERFSSVNLLEAMARGKPIIATNLGEQREFIENGVNGYLVEPGDEEALSLKIQQILGNKEERLRLSEQALISSKNYSLNNFVRTLQSMYMDLASNNMK
jgi:glycosyltransferase involved in cell wall biosynthesis